MSLFIRYLLMVAPYARRWRERLFARLLDRDLRAASQLANDAWLSPEGLPASNPSTLTSSSTPSQCIPCPLPINRQLLRSFCAACSNLGYQDKGTEIVRPSLRSTDRVSSVMVTFSASGTSISTAEVRIPSLQQLFLLSR